MHPTRQLLCTAGYIPNINHLFVLLECIALVDFIGQNAFWDLQVNSDQRGDDIADQIEGSYFVIINEDTKLNATAHN